MMPRARLIAATAMVALLCGCSSTPVTRSYVLSAAVAAPAAAGTSAAPVTVVIKNLTLPQYLDRSQIVIRGGGHRIQIVENELWAGNLRQDMTRVLVENLGRLLASDRVVAAPYSVPLQPDYRVEVEVLRFERGTDARVALVARWWLTRGSDGVLLASPSETYLGSPLVADTPFEALVASMSAVYAELAQAIARGILAAGTGGTGGTGGPGGTRGAASS